MKYPEALMVPLSNCGLTPPRLSNEHYEALSKTVDTGDPVFVKKIEDNVQKRYDDDFRWHFNNVIDGITEYLRRELAITHPSNTILVDALNKHIRDLRGKKMEEFMKCACGRLFNDYYKGKVEGKCIRCSRTPEEIEADNQEQKHIDWWFEQFTDGKTKLGFDEWMEEKKQILKKAMEQ